MFEASRDHLPAIAQSGWAVLNWLYDINGQQYWAVAMFASTLLYIAVSLLGRKVFDLDRLLHRGAHALPGESGTEADPSRGWRLLGMGPEFSRGDRIIVIASYCWTGTWTLVFIAGTIWNLSLRDPAPDYSSVAEPARSALIEAAPLIDEAEWERAAELLAPYSDPVNGESAALQQRYGLCLQRSGRYEEALPELERAVALDPEFGRAWVILAEAARELGLIERAQHAAELGVTHLDPVSRGWGDYWRFYVFLNLGMSIFVIAWFTVGGIKDLRAMFGRLDTMERNTQDDGRVRKVKPDSGRSES
jgi:tetratricopeptide (TPR) repeat protein